MANPLTLELAPSAARTTGASGAAIDIGALRTAARVETAVTVAAAGADHVLGLTLETSGSASGPWRAVADLGAFQPGAEPAMLEKYVAGLQRYVRAKWTIDGAAPSFTFQVTAEAHVLYAEPKHIRRFGTDDELAEFCIMASTEADGHLAIGRTLPLTKWDADLRRHVSKIAIYIFLNDGGRVPTGPDDLIDIEYKDAIKWLRGVGNGTIVPPGLVDSTPEVNEAAYAVVSDPPTEW